MSKKIKDTVDAEEVVDVVNDAPTVAEEVEVPDNTPTPVVEEGDTEHAEYETATQEDFGYLIGKYHVRRNIISALSTLTIAAKEENLENRYGKLLEARGVCSQFTNMGTKSISGCTLAKLFGKEEEIYVMNLACHLIEAFHNWNTDTETPKTVDPATAIDIIGGIISDLDDILHTVNSRNAVNDSIADIKANATRIRLIHESINWFYRTIGAPEDPYLAISICHGICNSNAYAELLEASL